MGSTGGVTSDTLSAIAPRNGIASTGTVDVFCCEREFAGQVY